MWKYPQDLTGMRFGRLTVTEKMDDYIDDKTGKHIEKWKCSCDCGGEKITRRINLLKGATKSCGCLKTEHNIEMGKGNAIRNKKYNQYNLSREYGIGYTLKGEEFYFDVEDYEKIKDYCWHINKKGYVISSTKDGKTLQMHSLIMGTKGREKIVDHIITENKNDNRKRNLRIISQTDNCKNRKKNKNNTSGIRGVYWHKHNKKWVACISIKRKNIILGSSINIEEAAKLREEAEIKYYGEYRYKGGKL